MSTSEYEYRVLMDGAVVGDNTHALDARTARIIMSNLNHLADEYAQVGSCMSGTVPSLSGKAGYLVTGTPTSTTVAYRIVSHLFPIKVRAGGQSYRFRVRIGGASGNTASTVFYATVGAPSASVPLTSDAAYQTAATTSSTAAWLTGASLGTSAYTTMMQMTGDQVAGCIVDAATLTALGGDPATTEVAIVQLRVSATTANIAHIPRLYSLYLAEYIGK